MAPIVLREIPCDVPSGRAALHSPLGTIRIELARGEIFEPGLIAGAEGLGSELFLDPAHRLVSLDLDLRPHHVISVPPAGIVRSARDSIRAAARPTCVGIDSSRLRADQPRSHLDLACADAAILALAAQFPNTPRAFLSRPQLRHDGRSRSRRPRFTPDPCGSVPPKSSSSSISRSLPRPVPPTSAKHSMPFTGNTTPPRPGQISNERRYRPRRGNRRVERFGSTGRRLSSRPRDDAPLSAARETLEEMD